MRLPSQLPALKDLKLNLGLGRRGGSVVGLDIQPGLVAAVQARANGSIVVEKAAAMALAPDMLRDGEVADDAGLADALRELFNDSGLGKRVRIGIANQRTVLRTLELPPVTDAKELAAAVTFQAQEQVPMPLNNAVLDFHALGVIDTPAGPRQRVVLVAAQRDMVERLLAAVDSAGLIAEGVDLSAFALIRSLYTPDPEPDPEAGELAQRVLYLNVDGLTNLAIAEGPLCRFTRVVGGGIEAMAAELAAKREITVQQARVLLLGARLGESEAADEWMPGGDASLDAPAHEDAGEAQEAQEAAAPTVAGESSEGAAMPDAGEPDTVSAEGPAVDIAEPGEHDHTGEYASDSDYQDFASEDYADDAEADVWGVLESGIRDIYGEVRNSLDFHRSQEGGGEVSHVVLSGSAQDIPGFADALQSALGVEVKTREVRVSHGQLEGISAHRLAVAAGLSVLELEQ